MKKTMSIILLVVFVALMASCGTNSSQKATQNETIIADENEKIDVTEIKKDVIITMPSYIFEEGATDVLTDEQKNLGFKKAVVNDDGSVTYTISADKYDFLIQDTKKNVEDSLKKLTTDYETIKSVEHNDDFSEIILVVSNKSKFNNSFSEPFSILSAGISGMLYQTFDVNCKNTKVHVKVKDVKTNKVFKTTIYPDSLE